MKTNTYMNFAKRIVMVLAIGLMAVNVWGANQTYNLVSDYSSLSSTDKILIVAYDGSSKYYALKNNQVSTADNLPTTEVNVSSNTIEADLETNYTWYPEYDAEVEINSTKYRSYYLKSTQTGGSYYLQNAGATKSSITAKNTTYDSYNKWVLGYTAVNTTTEKSCLGLWNVNASRMMSLFVSTGKTPTYTFRAYGSNDYGNIDGHTVYIYRLQTGDAITLNKNTTDAGSTAGAGTIAADATTMTINTPPTRTGYDIEGYYTAATEGTKIATAAGVLQPNVLTWTNGSSQWKKGGDATFYTYWTAKEYSVTLNGNSATTAGSNSVTLTYNSASHAAITNPKKTHYIFNGWYTGEGGTGNLVIATDGTLQANVEGYTGAGGVWTRDEATNLYAKWTEHTYKNYRTKCCTPLDAPANIAVSVTGAETATVTWDAVTDATGYDYSFDGETWTSASSPLNLTGLTSATGYSIYLRTNGSGDNCTAGEASAGTNFTTYSTITAASNDALMGTAKVSLNGTDWYDAVEAEDGTTIYLQATAASALYEFSNWATPASGSISSNQLTSWEGDVTVTANFQTQSLTELDVPTGMGLVGTAGAISATIKWYAVDHASSYLVTCAGATIGDVTVTDGVASCTLTGLTADTEYTWNVQAVGDNISYKSGSACANQNFTTDKKKPTSISITTPPTKTTYVEGETFDATGMVVVVNYNTGESDAIYTVPSSALEFGTTAVTLTASLNNAEVTTTQAITVLKKYVLTFKNNGSEVSHVDLYEGAAYGTLPTLTSGNCDATSSTFRGWTTAEINVKTNTAPTYAKATDVMPAADVVLNAVWAKQTGHEGYDLVTSPTSCKTYIFVSGNSAGSAYALHAKDMNTNKTAGTHSPAKGVTISSGSPVYVGTVDEELEFVFSDDKYSIVSRTGYYFYINGSGVSRRDDAQGTWDANNGLYATSSSGKTTYYLSLDTSGETPDYYYATSSASANRVYAFEKQEISYGEYITHCISSAVTIATLTNGSTITVKNGDDAVANGDAFAPGVELTITTNAASGYRVDNLRAYKTGDESTAVAITEGTLTMPAYPITITAEETAVYPVYVTVASGQSTWGSVTINGEAGPAYVNEDDNPEIEATPNAGYQFKTWAVTGGPYELGDKSLTDASIAPQVSAEATFTATFEEKPMTGLTLSQDALTVDLASGTASLSVTGYTPSDLLDAKKTIAWSSSDETVATVSNGTITLKKAGTATITAAWTEDESVKAECALNIYQWNFVNYTVAPTPETEYTDADQFDKSSYAVTANYVRSDDNNEHNAVELDADDWTVKLGETEISDTHDFVAGNTGDNGKELAFYVGESKVWYSDVTVTEVAKDRFIDGLWGNATIVKTGENYALPTLTERLGDAGTCSDHTTFAGWVEASKADNPTAGDIETGAHTAFNKTYYAVWSKSENVNKDFTVSKNSFASGDNGLDASVNIGTDISYRTQRNGGTSNPAVVSGPVLRLYKLGSNQSYGGSITISAVSGASLKKVEMTVSYATYKYIKNTYTTTGLQDGTITDGKIVLDNISSNNLTIVNVGSTQLDISKIEVTYSKTVTEIDYITDCEPRYDVQFNTDGATGSYDKVTKKAGVKITLPDGSALSKDHHTFAGWYSAHYDATYSATNEWKYIVPAGGETLVAQWTEDHHAFVTFKNGESTIGEPLKVYDGGLYNLLDAQEADGKAFIGWKWNNEIFNAGLQNQHMSDIAADRTYVAVWMSVIDVATAASADLSDGKWILVQNKSQLKAGDFIVIAAAGYDAAMSTTQGTSNRDEAAVTKSVDTLSYTSNVAPLFLQYDSENDYYAFYDRNYTKGSSTDLSGYLYAQNALKTQENLTQQCLWSIDIVDKKASIICQGKNTDKYMLYNPASNAKLFNVYGSATQKDIAIYKWAKNISSDMNVSDVTNTDIVIVNDGSTLTIDEPTTLDNLIVEAGGKVSGSANLIVNDLTIKTSLGTISGDDNDGGKSGEISNSNITANGDVWIEIELTQASQASFGWYAFSVPFPVNTMNGVYYQNTPLQNEVGYAIMAYHEDERAAGNYAWKKYRETNLVPGMLYIITVGDTDYKTLRFKKAQGTDLIASNSVPVSYTTASGEGASGWNGVGNPNLQVSHQNDYTYLQFLDHDDNCFRARTAATTDLLVGTAFMVQVAESTESITIATGANTGTGNIALAPAREPKAIENTIFEVKLRNTDTGKTEDNLFFTAREDATNEYEIGRDVAKMSMGDAKCAQMWVPAYGTQLCAADFQLVNNQAEYPLTINTPKAGTYSISAQENENATIYLTQNGSIIWNLSMSACELDLAQGQNEGYGLKLVINAPAVVTGVDQIDAKADVQKVIIDEHVFILRGGQMYDVNGKMVK